MEDNSQNNKTTSYKIVDFSTNSNKEKNSFSKTILLPFFSGILGTSLVIGTCFGIPRNT